MKKINLLINLVNLLILSLLIALFFLQLKRNSELEKEVIQKKQEFEEARAASRRLEKLEKLELELKQEEESNRKKVPIAEKQPLSLMKNLIKAGAEIGARKITFSLKDNSSGGLMGMNSPGSEQGLSGTAETASMAKGSNSQMSQSSSKPKPLNLAMSFIGTFPQAVAYLERIIRMDRIVVINKITIERQEKLLPYQKISLELVAYTF